MPRLGVCGWPVAHSRSPRMHNAALAHLGLDDWRYQTLPLPPHLFTETVRALPAAGFRGVNVTIPHKEAALALADVATETASAIGAANTLDVRATTARSTPTTPTRPGFSPRSRSAYGKTALVLGAGGSARAVLYALKQAGAADVARLEPHPERARKRSPTNSAPRVGAQPGRHRRQLHVRRACTTRRPRSRRSPSQADDLGAGCTVVDMVYRNGGTLLLERRRRRTGRTWSTDWRSWSPRAQRHSNAGPAGRLPTRRCGRPSQTSPR